MQASGADPRKCTATGSSLLQRGLSRRSTGVHGKSMEYNTNLNGVLPLEVDPRLLPRVDHKWHVKNRNVKKGGVILIQDGNALRRNWKIGFVIDVLCSHGPVSRRS